MSWRFMKQHSPRLGIYRTLPEMAFRRPGFQCEERSNIIREVLSYRPTQSALPVFSARLEPTS